MKYRAGLFWWEVGKFNTLDVKPRLPMLIQLMEGLLSIPLSNTNSDRDFSILRRYTDQRSNLNQSTIIYSSYDYETLMIVVMTRSCTRNFCHKATRANNNLKSNLGCAETFIIILIFYWGEPERAPH